MYDTEHAAAAKKYAAAACHRCMTTGQRHCCVRNVEGTWMEEFGEQIKTNSDPAIRQDRPISFTDHHLLISNIKQALSKHSRLCSSVASMHVSNLQRLWILLILIPAKFSKCVPLALPAKRPIHQVHSLYAYTVRSPVGTVQVPWGSGERGVH